MNTLIGDHKHLLKVINLNSDFEDFVPKPGIYGPQLSDQLVILTEPCYIYSGR